ncbi:ABC transporter ATP-binding protein [Rhodococcus sp. ABRD24]|uniref:ABC transporter ATP-binding protein n=1 Tax=Rhodococcus sp. ABRD24 TaxID=2507582 RepID=UPI0010388D5E|nr:ABC transporter ATP-binding protein [Rhodococcus sp. ABRD24]QBJ95743.1 ABC transporter ATP-binding protein [Rhodococcus sp. ABRD24]
MTTTERTLLPTASPARTRAELWRLLRRHRIGAVAAVVALTVGTAVGLCTPLTLGAMVDAVTRAESDVLGTVGWLAGALVAIAVGQSVMVAVSNYLIARVGETLVADLREEVLDHALDLPQEDLEEAGRGDLISRVSGDVHLVAEAVSRSVPVFATATLTIGLTLVGLAGLDWRFAIAAVIVAPIQIGALRWYLRTSAPVYRQEREAEGARAQQMLDSLTDVDTVGALRLAPAHEREIESRSLAAVRLSLLTTKLRTRFFGRLNLAEALGLSAVLGVGFLLVQNGQITLGAATAAALFFHRLFDPISSALAVFDQLQEGSIALSRLVGVTLMPRPQDPAEPATPTDGCVALERVSFTYRAGVRPVVDGIGTRIEAGSSVALVGPTGAGKSTLAKLVAGTHDPDRGRVEIGGVDRSLLAAEDAVRTCVLVSQETHVFAGSIADNLRLARPDASDDDLMEALAVVGASDWVRSLPDGPDTFVGAGGAPVTSTEAQQLALARVALLDPAVLILDEATAEAGSAGARKLDRAAAALGRGRTTITVAHRLSQAALADRVLVVEDGRIVEDGPHEILVAAGGVYAKLWAAWESAR